MIRNDEHWLALTDTFQAAAFGQQSWYSALEGLASATGSYCGELIGLGADSAVPFNVMTNVDPGLQAAFLKSGGGDPRVNPRVNAGMHAPVLKVLAESDFITPDEYKRHPHYQEFAVPWKIPYICLTTLERTQDLLIGLAVLRDQRQGHITNDERHNFALLAPHVRAAVRTQLALEGDGAALLIGAMDALSLPAFVCDRYGNVRAYSPAAEQLLTLDRGLALKSGRLRALNSVDDKALRDAVDRGLLGPAVTGLPSFQAVVVHYGPMHLSSVVLDVITLPARQFEFSFPPRLLILVRGEHGHHNRRATLLQTAYALTAAETEIAMQVANGKSPDAIAALRGVAVGTVRHQIKAILAKLGVKRQVELAAKISQL